MPSIRQYSCGYKEGTMHICLLLEALNSLCLISLILKQSLATMHSLTVSDFFLELPCHLRLKSHLAFVAMKVLSENKRKMISSCNLDLMITSLTKPTLW
jgi:hypothetical protein